MQRFYDATETALRVYAEDLDVTETTLRVYAEVL